MPDPLDSDELGQVIFDFASQQNSVCFAGAGVGARAGLPDWVEFIEGLADFVEEYEPESAALMRKRLADEELAEAAHVYKRAAVPEGVLYQKLGEPFLNYEPAKLRALASLPFTAFVTTNYDRALHDAWAAANGKAPLTAELGDQTLRTFIHEKRTYIARVHGRAELPQTMVIDSDDFDSVLKDPTYGDFLFHILSSQRCMFIGYSFVDPAIRNIMLLFREKVGPNFQQEHLALIPQGRGDLGAELRKFNVKCVQYKT